MRWRASALRDWKSRWTACAVGIPYGWKYWWELYLADSSFSGIFEDWHILIWWIGELQYQHGRGQVLQPQCIYEVSEIPIGRIFGRFKFGRPAAHPPNHQIKLPANISRHTVSHGAYCIYLCHVKSATYIYYKLLSNYNIIIAIVL